MSSYNYQPIDPDTNTIRLLRLFQGRRYYDDELICGQLFEAEIPHDRDDTYEALSYTWGDSTRLKTITINDQKVAVTINLYDALFHLRDPEKDRILWVDALCINQQDACERTHQVAKMSLIYQKAWAVIIWLGRTTRDIELLLEVTQALDKIVRQRPRPSNNAEHLKVWIEEGRKLISEKKIINPDFYEIRQRALKNLLSRSWFRRVWVVQEAANAKMAYIQCSWISVPTRTFCVMPHLLETDMEVRSQALLEVLPGPLRQNSWWNGTRDLSTVLQKFSTCESTDPRDQIFALLGLSADCANDGHNFLPNYELNTLECIQQTIFFLAFGEIQGSDMYTLPTWDLEEFRHKLPSLRLSLLEWGIEQNQNGVSVVRKLLQGTSSFNVNQRIFSDQLPLHYLISTKKSMEMMRVYLDHDELDIHHANAALNVAAEQGRVDIIHALLGRKDAEILHSARDIQSTLECAIRINRSNAFDTIYHAARDFKRGMSQYDKISLLHYAASRGSIFAITKLVRDGVHADATQDPGNLTPLTIVIEEGFVAAVELLAQSGADLNREDDYGRSPLFKAARRGDLEMSRTLMDMGANIPTTIIPSCIHSWIHSEVIPLKEMLETVELLVSRGANINATTGHIDHVTGLFQAVEVRKFAMVECLIRLGAEPDIKNGEGDTALTFAARKGYRTAVDLLVTAGASLAEEGRFGRNALWDAVVYCRIGVVQLLDQCGADFQLSEDTALGLPDRVFAREGIRLEMRQYLQSRGLDLSAWEAKPREQRS